MEWLIELDKLVFLWIQQTGNSAFTDSFMLALRHASTWIPFYVFMLYWVIMNARRYAFIFIVLTVASFGLADFSSASILKPLIERPRPCYETGFEGQVRAMVGCGGQFGFPSSHAANHFALASFWYWLIRMLKGQRWGWLFAWALLIGYAQVYVGKHFPVDILGGALLGLFIGIIFAKLFEKWFFWKIQREERQDYQAS